jgi:hypothetical protein
MVIFARLVLMLFAILFSAGIGGAAGATIGGGKAESIISAAIGGIVGIFIGKGLGNMVVGKPPKD